MNIFILRRKNLLFSRYLNFMFLVKPKTLKYVAPSFTLLHIKNYTFDCFFRILGSIKENLIIGNSLYYSKHFKDIFSFILKNGNFFQVFYGFNNIALQCDLLILIWICLQLVFWLIKLSWRIKKSLYLWISLLNQENHFLKTFFKSISVSWTTFMAKWYSKLNHIAHANTHYHVTTFKFHEIWKPGLS